MDAPKDRFHILYWISSIPKEIKETSVEFVALFWVSFAFAYFTTFSIAFCRFASMCVFFPCFSSWLLVFYCILSFTSVGLVRHFPFTSVTSFFLFFPIRSHHCGNPPCMFVFPFLCLFSAFDLH